MIIVTTPEIPGYRVEAVLGPVTGAAASFTNTEKSRDKALTDLEAKAQRMGADAVLGISLVTYPTAGGTTEMCFVGTAVVVEAIPAGEPGATRQSADLVTRTGQGAHPYGYPVQDAPVPPGR